MSKSTHLDLPIRFGTVGSPASASKNKGSLGGIECLRELNLGALELAWVQSIRISDEMCAKIKEAGAQSDIAISVHASYYINLNAATEEMWLAGRERLLTAARAGYKAGATDIIFHPGSYMKQPPAEASATAMQRLSEVAETLKKEHVLVTLRPETMGKSALLGTLAEVITWSQQIETVLPCVDFAHLHARAGDGTFNTYDEFTSALDMIASGLGKRGIQHMHIHFSGIAYTAKGERNHLNLADADLNYKAFFKALADCGAHGRVLSETPNMEEDAVLMQNTYRRAWEKSGKGA
ncbi:MAG TPA: TIM barrel protein [Anaerolineae bacterium]